MATQLKAFWPTAAEAEDILEQLQRLLSSHAFRNSQRYPALLRYVVEQTVAGHADELKERTLGVAVFHRQPDYDSNADPIVRVTAGEVRKRLAQYYQEHEGELRIELPTGSYVPQFRAAAAPLPLPLPLPLIAEVREEPVVKAATTKSIRTRHVAGMLVALLLLAGLFSSLFLERSRRLDPLAKCWLPLTQAHQIPSFIVGGRASVYLAEDGTPLPVFDKPRTAEESVRVQPDERVTTLAVGDAFAFARVASLLTQRGSGYVAASAAQTSLEDLRARPSILFGAFNNAWTLHATSQLRFRLGYDKSPDDSNLVWIEDSRQPGKRWSLDCAQPIESATRDYAIVARYFDQEIEQQIVIAAGLQQNGTTAASEFLTSNRYLAQLDRFAPKGGWSKRNFEAVIETEVVGGRSGPPRVVAAAFW